MLDKKKKLWILFLLFFFSGVLVIYTIYFLPFIADDALISLRYAKRFLEGKGLNWTDGHPVEGYSNLLWILLISVAGLFNIDLVFASRLLGYICSIGTITLIIVWFIRNYDLNHVLLPLISGLFLLCFSAAFAVYTISGLEQALLGFLIALSIVFINLLISRNYQKTKYIFFLSFILGLLCITRPDGPIFTIAAMISILTARIFSKEKFGASRNILLLLIFPVGFYTAQLAFRFFYYGELIPNSAIVKISPSQFHFSKGLDYIGNGFLINSPFFILSIFFTVIMLHDPDKRKLCFYPLTVIVLWTTYIIFIGGDIFPAFRHFIPLIIAFTFLYVEGFVFFISKFNGQRLLKVKTAMILIITMFISIYNYLQVTNRNNRFAATERWEWDGKVIGLLLKDAFTKEQPLIASSIAGSIPYWSELPSLDMLGLNDHFLPRNPPEDFGYGVIGHELGNGQYILSRKPDIIIFNLGSNTDPYRSATEMEMLEEFHKNYAMADFKGYDPHELSFKMFINKNSSKIGIIKTSSEISIPPYLFIGNFSYLNKNNKLVNYVTSDTPLKFNIGSSFNPDSIKDKNMQIKIISPNPEKIKSELAVNDSILEIILSTESTEPVEIEEIILSRPDNY